MVALGNSSCTEGAILARKFKPPCPEGPNRKRTRRGRCSDDRFGTGPSP